MNQPKVSIIVPVYNVEKYLKCSMDSLMNQTLKDIEIILVDDGSPDHCPAMCDEYAKQDHRVKVIHKKNEGLGFARNSGLEIATGEYIAFVDSDDYVALGTYLKLYSIMEETNVDVVYFSYQGFDVHGNKWMGIDARKEKRYQNEEEVRQLMLDMIGNPPEARYDNDTSFSAWSGLYRHDVIKKYGIRFKSEREFMSEDLVFNLDYLLHSSKVINIPDAFYHYRVNPSSLSRAVRPDRITKIHFLYQYILEFLLKNNFEMGEGYLRATRYFIGSVRCYIRIYLQSTLSKREKMQWLKETVNLHYWQEISISYPYRKLPVKQRLHFFLLYKGHCHLLYYLELIDTRIKQIKK